MVPFHRLIEVLEKQTFHFLFVSGCRSPISKQLSVMATTIEEKVERSRGAIETPPEQHGGQGGSNFVRWQIKAERVGKGAYSRRFDVCLALWITHLCLCFKEHFKAKMCVLCVWTMCSGRDQPASQNVGIIISNRFWLDINMWPHLYTYLMLPFIKQFPQIRDS